MPAIEGAPLAIEVAEQTVTLILLPGLDGTEVFFRPLLSVLPEWVKPVVVNYPTTGANGYEDLLPLVNAAFEGRENVYVLGWSFSGPLALMAAAREPHRIKGVILCASFVRSPILVRAWTRLLGIAPVIGLLRFARRVPIVLGKRQDDPYRRAKAETWARVPARVLAARIRAILAVDASGYLGESRHPLLYLASSDDEIIPRQSGVGIVREARQAKLVTIEGPHLAMYTNPGVAVGAIVAFMQEVHEQPSRSFNIPGARQGSVDPDTQ